VKDLENVQKNGLPVDTEKKNDVGKQEQGRNEDKKRNHDFLQIPIN
jgi:hypothetical protein